MGTIALAHTGNRSLSAEPKRVSQFILGQTNIRECVPFVINRNNVI